MIRFFSLFILLIASFAVASDPSRFIAATSSGCILLPDKESSVSLNDLMNAALERGCEEIRISEGEWQIDQSVVLNEISANINIQANTKPPVLKGRSPLIVVRKSRGLSFSNLILEGTVEMDQTEDIRFYRMTFRDGGLHFTGRKCNQPNECISYNRRIHVEECLFENCLHGIRAERLEYSRMEKNRFTGQPANCTSETIGIELDGSTEDLDRSLELGHSKGNQLLHNSFEQESSIGIRVRDSWSNVIRENHFVRSYRAMEFYEGARHNQVFQNYITYLSQEPVSGACPSTCAIYLKAGSVNNIFWNNFFEQNFELQFLEANRNRTYIIDESGGQNVFRSDFLRLP